MDELSHSADIHKVWLHIHVPGVLYISLPVFRLEIVSDLESLAVLRAT